MKKRLDLLVAVALAIGTVLLLLPSQEFDVINYDDQAYMSGDGHVPRGLTWEGFRWALSERHFVIPVPLTWLSLMANTSVLGYSPGSFRVVNILIHVCNVLLVYALARLLCGKRVFLPIIASVVFAWHPTRLESVSWISERKDVLSIFFLLLTLIGYLYYGRRRTAARYFGCVVLPFLLSLASKPSTVVIPALLMLLDFWPLRRVAPEVGNERFSWGRLARLARDVVRCVPDKLPLFVVAGAIASVTWRTAQEQGATVSWEQFTLLERLANLPITYGLYAFRLLYPFELALFVPHTMELPPLWQASGGWIFLGVATWVAFQKMWENRLGFASWLIFLGVLIPVSGLFQNGGQLVAFRYTYLPYLGLVLFLGSHLEAWFSRRVFRDGLPTLRRENVLKWTGWGLVFGVATFCMIVTLAQLPKWANGLSIWQDALLTTKRNYVANNNLVGPLAEAGALREAKARARRAVEFDPSSHAAITNLASTSLSVGLVQKADRLFTIQEPRLVKWLKERGYDISSFDVSLQDVDAIRINPVQLAMAQSYARQLYLRAVAAALNRRPDVGEVFLDAALWAYRPVITDFTAFSLAAHFEVEGYDAVSARVLEAMNEEMPNNFLVLCRGALLFAMSEDERVYNPEKAKQWFAKALAVAPHHEAVIASGGVLYGILEGREAAGDFVRTALEDVPNESRARSESLWKDYQKDPQTTLRRLRGWPRDTSKARSTSG
ncbi:MAG: hypothetical protein SNJ52_03740 [Verrucomicrobiia bacterium]